MSSSYRVGGKTNPTTSREKGSMLTLLRLHEICQYALRHPHRVGEREGASLLQVLQQVQAHFGGAVFGVLRV
jgi:hypothetical protein